MGIPRRYTSNAAAYIQELNQRMTRERIIYPGDIALSIAKHKAQCQACLHQKACKRLQQFEIQLANALEQARWKPPVKYTLSNLPTSWTNPECIQNRRHGYAAEDTTTCPHCQAYSAKKRAERETKGEAPK